MVSPGRRRVDGPLEDSVHSSSITSLSPEGCRDIGGPSSYLGSVLQPPRESLQQLLLAAAAAVVAASASSASSSFSSPLPPPFPLAWPGPTLFTPTGGPASLRSPHPGAWLHEAGGGGGTAREVPAAPGTGKKVQKAGMELEKGKFIADTK